MKELCKKLARINVPDQPYIISARGIPRACPGPGYTASLADISGMTNVDKLHAIPLWSYHPPAWSLLQGRVDPKQSPYSDDVNIMTAYEELHRRIGTDQLIWCYTNKDEFPKTGTPKVEWAFEVPRSSVLCFLDGVVWQRIIGGRSLTRELWAQLEMQALEKFPYDSERREAYLIEITNAFWGQKPPNGSWWNNLFVEFSGANQGIDALIPHPANEKWYVDHRTISIASLARC